MPLNKAQLISQVAGATGMTKVEVEKAVKATIGAISGELANAGNVTLIGFGTFSVLHKKARTGKNPRTGESIKIPAKIVPKFKPGKALAEKVDSLKVSAKKKAPVKAKK